MHKPTLKRERAIRYDRHGEMMMINNLDKVYSEIELWTQLNHPYIAKLYEMIDDDEHDYLYLILEMADMRGRKPVSQRAFDEQLLCCTCFPWVLNIVSHHCHSVDHEFV